MKTILLYGHLRRRFGKLFKLNVDSPCEAVRALCAILPGFQSHVMINSEPGYRVMIGDIPLGLETLHHPAGQKAIKIIPVVAGAAKGALGQIILGAALIALAVFTGGAGLGLGAAYTAGTAGTLVAGVSGVAGGILGVASAVAFNIGISMVLGGLVQALFKPPTPDKNSAESPTNRPSYAFNGAVNTLAQGNPVPICYGGPITVGSQVVSAGLFVTDTPIVGSVGGPGSVQVPITDASEDFIIETTLTAPGQLITATYEIQNSQVEQVTGVYWIIDNTTTVSLNKVSAFSETDDLEWMQGSNEREIVVKGVMLLRPMRVKYNYHGTATIGI